MITRKYGRKVPKALPPHRMLVRTAAPRILFFDGVPWKGPTKDQGDEGSCTGHAGSSGAEWIFRHYFKKSPVFSPQYTYAKELIAQGDFPNDTGSDGVTLCNTMIASGLCPLDQYPYQAGQILKPTTEQDEAAAEFRLGAFHGLVGSSTALSVLADPTPWPIEIGFTVYESFESDQVANTGIMPIPKPGEAVKGGHEVVIIGFDVNTNPRVRPANCPPAVQVQNSWGDSWGLTGMFWMPLQVLDLPDTDLKIAHSGHPW